MRVQKFIDVQGYDGLYQAGDLGCIKSLKYGKERILKKSDKNGYKKVHLSMNGKVKSIPIHRLVALAFIPNPENKPCVNHINGVRDDNRVENLEWCTYKENEAHKYCVLGYKPSIESRMKMSKSQTGRKHTDETKNKISNKNKGRVFTCEHKEKLSKKIYCLDTLRVWNSVRSCADEFGIKHKTLSSRLNGKLKNKTSLRYLE